MNENKKKIIKKVTIVGATIAGTAIGGVAGSVINNETTEAKNSEDIELQGEHTKDNNNNNPMSDQTSSNTNNVDEINMDASMQELLLKATNLTKIIQNL